MEHYKAQLVTQGYTQKYGTDEDETCWQVVGQESLRVLLTSEQHRLGLHQVDVAMAFLKGNLEEEVYTAQPEGFVSQGK